ncbi:MAG: mechanosensitive ion channel family protein [Pseudomonadota bacterium]|uniref:mechanosensitive ion channel family protein n=1 Tax=Gallaecimonas pentaromativorans TaxID=584787 RepID=UPI00067EDA01|nr:mechanosensitive ion channel family protein [Gallaecimonas pentaromativorans]MED5525681.1 mechanosensitive ion channel family protein [Pseudomonadota bacterium]
MAQLKSLWQSLYRAMTDWLGEGWLVDVLVIIAVTLLVTVLWRVVAKRLVNLVGRSSSTWDDMLWDSLNGPVNWLILLVGVSMVAQTVAGRIDSELANYLPVLRKVLFECLIAWSLWRLTNGGEHEFIRRGRDITTVQAVGKLLKASIIVVFLLTLFQTLGVNISGILALGGVGGLVIGMAAKDLLANFFGSLVVYFDKPFKVGDWIRSPDRPIEGTVERIGFRVTQIRTFDQRPLYVPNSVFTQISVENPSRMLNRRINETIGIRYEDADKMGDVVAKVKDMLENHPDIDQHKTLMVNFNAFGPSSLDFFIYTFTKTTVWAEYHQVKQDVMLKIIHIIHELGADCAFPTQTLHIESLPEGFGRPAGEPGAA